MPVTESATPQTISLRDPTRTVDPVNTPSPRAMTICPPVAAQVPSSSVRSSTGPPGEDRPAIRSGTGEEPGTPGTVTRAVTDTLGYGPPAAVTPGSRAVAAICAGVAAAGSTAAVMSAPFCRANARSNAPLALATKPSATTDVAVAASTTTPIIPA